jgi:hypothetical protein
MVGENESGQRSAVESSPLTAFKRVKSVEVSDWNCLIFVVFCLRMLHAI